MNLSLYQFQKIALGQLGEAGVVRLHVGEFHEVCIHATPEAREQLIALFLDKGQRYGDVEVPVSLLASAMKGEVIPERKYDDDPDEVGF